HRRGGRPGRPAAGYHDDDEGNRAVVYLGDPINSGQSLLRSIFDLRSYAALAGTALASFRASSMALATPSLRATTFTRVRSTPLSLRRAARYCPCRLRAARALAVIVNLRLGFFATAARGPAGRPAALAAACPA